MCGIVAISSSKNVVQKLYKSLLNLEYRGYDSCGIAIIKNKKIEIRKDRGHVKAVAEKLRFHEMTGTIGIGHTRWATTGKPSLNNAHPHLSCSNDFALIHNGIINNYRQLREELIQQGHEFKSDTDTEVLVHLLEQCYEETSDIESAMRKCMQRIDGTYAYAFITTYDPHNIYCARFESPLIIGLGNDENYIGSDYNAILEYTKNVVTILNGEYAIVNHDTVTIKKSNTGEIVDHEINQLNWDPELSKKGGFPHYMLKEIHEQSTTAETILNIDNKQIRQLVKEIRKASKIYLLGVGTTYYVALISQYYFAKICGRFFPAISSDEFPYTSETDSNTLVIAFSQSGETYDTLKALRFAKKHGARTAAIINVMGSSMVREVDIPIMQGSGPEICVLSTKAALSQILVSVRVANELGQLTSFITKTQYNLNLKTLKQFPVDIRTVLNEFKAFVHTLANKYSSIRNWLFIGRGIYYGVAMESALKMKEVTYQHAEGIPGGFMKHGTISLIEDGFGSLFFLPPAQDKELHQHTIANAEEIKARGGLLIGFGFGEKSTLFDEQIRLFDMDLINAPLMLLILGQLFAYYSAVALDRNVDKPRALAKSVTVA